MRLSAHTDRQNARCWVSSSSEAVSDNVIVDFDERGKPVGVTLEHYSQISDTSTIETLRPITPVLQPA